MRQHPIRLGPLALVLLVIVLCVSTLAILTYSTARADKNLAERYAKTVETRYQLEQRGQELYRDVDAALRGGDERALLEMQQNGLISIDGDVISAKIEEEGAVLSLSFRNLGNGRGGEVTDWRMIKNWEEDDPVPNVWDGK